MLFFFKLEEYAPVLTKVPLSQTVASVGHRDSMFSNESAKARLGWQRNEEFAFSRDSRLEQINKTEQFIRRLQ